MIILDWEWGQRQGKGGGFGNTLIIEQRVPPYALLLTVLDVQRPSDLNPKITRNEGVQNVSPRGITAWVPFWIHDIPWDDNVLHEACKPVLRQSLPFCLKELDFFFLKWTYITHPFLPHSPLTRHARGMKGVTHVEQDGFTSANVSNKTAETRSFFSPATHVDKMSSVLTDTLSLPCDPHWQSGLCHALGCNGTNAARDTAYCAFLPAHWTLAVQLCKTPLQ